MNTSAHSILHNLATIGIRPTNETKFAELLGHSTDPAKLVEIAAVGRRDGVRLVHSLPSPKGMADEIARVLSIPKADAAAIAANVQRSH